MDSPLPFLKPRKRKLRSGFILIFHLIFLFLAVTPFYHSTAEEDRSERENDSDFGLMNTLAKNGLHDRANEDWNLYGQYTFIYFWKPEFNAKYTNLNGSNGSLIPEPEHSYTQTFTFFLGVRPWKSAEFYFVPESIAEVTLSNLKGFTGEQENTELEKNGISSPTLYRSRVFVRQTFGLGGESVSLPSGPMQLGGKTESRRLVFTLGTFSALDLLDKNNVYGEPRKSLMSEEFMTDSAFDFAADARGYSLGFGAELYWDQWAFRWVHSAPAQYPNLQPIDLRFLDFYGDDLEFEHDHTLGDRPGAVRLLLFRNRETMGKFSDAIAAFQSDPSKNAANCGDLVNYGSQNAQAPDLCWVRHPNIKMGIGINLEQSLTEDTGIFIRAMYADGNTEVDAFDPADRSALMGSITKGRAWGRPLDTLGIGLAANWISVDHAKYLAMGGVDGFIGDGALNYGVETVMEFMYSIHVWKTLAASVDYQHVGNPGNNRDRGPVNLYGWRIHAEF